MDFDEVEIKPAKIIKWVAVAVLAVLVLVFGTKSCSSVGATERGVMLTFGKPGSEVLQPGLHLKSPIGQEIEKIDITPIEYEKTFTVGQDGALSKDQQTVGVTFTLYWKYDESRILEVVKNYKTTDSIYQPVSSSVKQALKDEVGKYSVEEIVQNQSKIATAVRESFTKDLEYLPVVITDFKIGNWDWSEDYDVMIKKTMARKQEVEQMKQEVALAEQAAQKQVKEAEAAKQKAILDAEAAEASAKGAAAAKIAKADGDAQAKKKEADALAYYNQKVAQNYQVEIKLKELEIELERAQRWDGRQVPNYVPLAANGTVVEMK